MIYFIRPRSGGAIKIGTTIRLSQRLAALQAEFGELEVVAVAAGSFAEESTLHHRFAHLRQHGEWFEPGDDLMAFIIGHGAPWDGCDEVPARPAKTRQIRVDDDIARMANELAAILKVPVPTMLSNMLRPVLREQLLAELEAKLSPPIPQPPGE